MSDVPEPSRISGALVAWVDFWMALAVAFMCIAALALVVVMQKAEANPPPGQLIVTLEWDTHIDADVDLWVAGPDGKAVGYLHRTSSVFDLLHDHRGHQIEGDFNNTEVAVARHLPAGLYVVNAVLYSTWDKVLPIPLHVTVDRIDAKHQVTHMFDKRAQITQPQQELTLIEFRLDSAGQMIPGSDVIDGNVCLWKAEC
jgi:hypothetical protein